MSRPKWLQESLPEVFDRQEILGFLALSYLAIFLVPAGWQALILLFRGPLPPAVGWGGAALALLAVLAALYRIHLRIVPPSQRRVAIGVFAVSMALALLVAGSLNDVTFDGMTYHAEAILGLAHGVNPIYARFPGNYPLWTNSYPKTAWYFAALAGEAFHRLEIGKCYNLVLMYACAVYSWRFFRQIKLGRPMSSLLAVAVALNPVAASELPTFYVDGAMASLLGLIVLSSALLATRKPERLDCTVFIAAGAAAATLKFTGALYVCVALALIFAMHLAAPRLSGGNRAASMKRLLGASALLAAAVLLLGFNPYVTNLLQGRNLFYPVAGANKINVLGSNGPDEFARPDRNRFQNLAVSFFARSSEAHGDMVPVLKVPFAVHVDEIKCFMNPDVRTAGWGVLFSGLFLLSVAIYLWAKGWQVAPEISFALLVVIATTASNPQSWWARFSPQVALLPVLLMAAALAARQALQTGQTDATRRTDARQNRLGAASLAVCGLYLGNSLLLLALALANSVRGTIAAHRSVKHIAEVCGPGTYWYDGNKVLIRYDMLPTYHGVSIVSRLPTSADLAAGVALPLTLMKGQQDTVHIESCQTGYRN